MAREPGSYITDPETGEEVLVHRTACDWPRAPDPEQEAEDPINDQNEE